MARVHRLPTWARALAGVLFLLPAVATAWSESFELSIGFAEPSARPGRAMAVLLEVRAPAPFEFHIAATLTEGSHGEPRDGSGNATDSGWSVEPTSVRVNVTRDSRTNPVQVPFTIHVSPRQDATAIVDWTAVAVSESGGAGDVLGTVTWSLRTGSMQLGLDDLGTTFGGTTSTYEVQVGDAGPKPFEIVVQLPRGWTSDHSVETLNVPWGKWHRFQLNVTQGPDAVDGTMEVIAADPEGGFPFATARTRLEKRPPPHVDWVPQQRVDASLHEAPAHSARLVLATSLAVAAGGATLLAAASRSERVRVAFLALATRVLPGRALEHGTREKICERIGERPGITFGELARAARIRHTTLAHHIRVLEQVGFVVGRADGQYRRFYLNGGAPASASARVTPAQEKVLVILREGPRSTTEVAKRLGLTRRGASYHLKELARAEVVVQSERGEWSCAVKKLDAP